MSLKGTVNQISILSAQIGSPTIRLVGIRTADASLSKLIAAGTVAASHKCQTSGPVECFLYYKTDTSLRRTTDTIETINKHLRSALCSEKYLKTEILMQVLYKIVNYKIFNILQSFFSLQSLYCYIVRFYTTKPWTLSLNERLIHRQENDSTVTVLQFQLFCIS